MLALRRIIDGIKHGKLAVVVTFVAFVKLLTPCTGKGVQDRSNIWNTSQDCDSHKGHGTTLAKMNSLDGEARVFEIKVLEGDTFITSFLVVVALVLLSASSNTRKKVNGYTLIIQQRQSHRKGPKTVTQTTFADDLSLPSTTLDQAVMVVAVMVMVIVVVVVVVMVEVVVMVMVMVVVVVMVMVMMMVMVVVVVVMMVWWRWRW